MFAERAEPGAAAAAPELAVTVLERGHQVAPGLHDASEFAERDRSVEGARKISEYQQTTPASEASSKGRSRRSATSKVKSG